MNDLTRKITPEEQYYCDKARDEGIPAYMVGGLVLYIVHKKKPGDFLCAVLRNDLRAAFERADAMNFLIVGRYVKFLYNSAPANCWGSEENFKRWIGEIE